MKRRFYFDLDEQALRNVVLALEQRLEFCEAWLSEYSARDDGEVSQVREAMRAERRDGQALLRMWHRMLDAPHVAALREGRSAKRH